MFGIGLPELIVIFAIFVIPIGGIFFLLISSNSQKQTISKILSNKSMEVDMAYCTKCGKEILEGSSFCLHCGENLSSVKSSILTPRMSSVLTNDDFATFVGKNSEKYLAKFAKFNIGGIDSFQATWHWPALFVPTLWMLYRKIYGWAILAFVTGWIPYIGWFLLPIVWAITANYLYYRQTKRKLLEIKQLHPSPETQRAVIFITGGVGYAALLIVVPIFFVAIIGILAAIAIPQFEAYRQRGYNAQAKTEIQSACDIASSILIDNPQKTISLRELGAKGLKLSPDIELIIHDGTSESLNIRASHNRGNKIYVADKNCSIIEEVKTR
jgi:Tfp pilus assembly major pilin PilA